MQKMLLATNNSLKLLTCFVFFFVYACMCFFFFSKGGCYAFFFTEGVNCIENWDWQTVSFMLYLETNHSLQYPFYHCGSGIPSTTTAAGVRHAFWLQNMAIQSSGRLRWAPFLMQEGIIRDDHDFTWWLRVCWHYSDGVWKCVSWI